MRVGKVGKAFLGLALAASVAGAGGASWAHWRANQPADAPYPAITADRSAEGLARGATIFHANCEGCHRPPGGERASGGPMKDIPSWIGIVESGNLTRHEATGIGARTDAEIARTIRYAVTHDGRRIFMPDSGMGDADVAAVLGFLRSDDPLFDPVERTTPPPKITLTGEVVLVAAGALDVSTRPANGIPVPPKEATKEYGEYLVHGVYDCAGCHTEGFARDKTTGERALAGGFEFADANGQPLVSANLTFHATGIQGFSRDDLARALRDGLRPDGAPVRYPMPRFRGVEDVEIDAIYAYLKGVPPRAIPTPRTPATTPLPARGPAVTSAPALFQSLGCGGCHGEGAMYRAAIAGARGKSEEDLASWIRNPEKYRPGTPMPTYAGVIDEPAARELASWIKRGGPLEASR